MPTRFYELDGRYVTKAEFDAARGARSPEAKQARRNERLAETHAADQRRALKASRKAKAERLACQHRAERAELEARHAKDRAALLDDLL